MCRSLSAFGVTALVFAVTTGSRGKCPSNGFERFLVQTSIKVLDSPNFPFSYSNNLNCSWLIDAPDDDHYIRLETNTMDMKYSNNCSEDSLSIYDGQWPSSPLLGRFCGKTAISTTSTGRRMLVVLATDSSADGKFQLKLYGVNSKLSTPASTTETTSEVKAEEHKKEDLELNTWLVAGGVLGGGVVFLVILCTVCMRRRSQHPPDARN
ncbi:hypothetical protein BaRGS_00021717 [Batillaria attramentaria]|uniref:CUB domain-containing protein n=1 Tax=Batillaria attramentaria TaxID=370345 RepID=A0ABD0KJC8_9CAEN